MGCTVVCQVPLLSHSKRVPDLKPGFLTACSSMCGFLPPSKNTSQVNALGLRVSVHGCLSLSLCWSCDGLANCSGCTLPLALWQLKWVSAPTWPCIGISRYRKRMNNLHFATLIAGLETRCSKCLSELNSSLDYSSLESMIAWSSKFKIFKSRFPS